MTKENTNTSEHRQPNKPYKPAKMPKRPKKQPNPGTSGKKSQN